MTFLAESAAILYGLMAALSWGGSDFSGGVATRRFNALGAVAVSQCIGLILLLVVVFFSGEAMPALPDLAWGAGAGLVGATSLILFYQALATGRMGLAAPVVAVVSAALPVLYNLSSGVYPDSYQITGFVLALVSIWLVSSSTGAAHSKDSELRTMLLAAVGGIGFGAFYILLDQVSEGSVFWPLAAARIASTSLMLPLALLTGNARLSLHSRNAVPALALAGTFDTAGNVFFVLATQAGRLDVAAVIASLYPAMTILLARLFLAERITRLQLVGIVAALIAIVLIAL